MQQAYGSRHEESSQSYVMNMSNLSGLGQYLKESEVQSNIGEQ